MAMIKAVLFDFDGTLAHYAGSFSALLDSLRAELMLTQCDLKSFAGVLSEELRQGGVLTLSTALGRTLERLELRAGPDLEEVGRQAVVDYGARVCLLPGAREMLEGLRGRVKLALVSNGPEDMQRAALARVGIAEMFDAVLISGAPEVGVRKPDRRIFERACAALGVGPAEALMVGDDYAADIGGARACGLAAVHLGADGEVVGDGVRRASDLQELREILRELLEA